MSLPAPSIVIFDMDGTTVRHLNPRLLHVMEVLDDLAYTIGRAFRAIFWRSQKVSLADFNLDEDLPSAEKKKRKNPQVLVHRMIHKVRRKSVDQIVEPCPGVIATLNLLKKHDIPTALVSNGLGSGYGHDILDKFDLEPFFKATVFREDIRHSKPNPEPILLALKHMDIKPKADDVIWYIGDRRKDIIAALAAAKQLPCKMVPIAYGLNASVAVVENGLSPEHIKMCFHDMGENLADILGPIPKGKKTDRASKTATANDHPASADTARQKARKR